MKKLVILALALFALTVLLAPAVLAADAPFAGIWTYANNDDFSSNSVQVFSISNTGVLTNMGAVPTGGIGSGGGYYGHHIISGFGDLLYVSNQASNTITEFKGRSTGSLTKVMDIATDQGTISLSSVAGGSCLIVGTSDSGTFRSYMSNGTPVSNYFVGGVDGIDAGKAQNGNYYAAVTAGSQLFVSQITPSTCALSTPTAYNTSGSGDLPAGVSNDPKGRGWYVGWANGFGTVVDYCTPMNAPVCTGYTISGGGVNSNTVRATGTCLYQGNQWTNTLTYTTVNGSGVPSTSGGAISFGSSIGTPELARTPTKKIVGLVVPSGPDNTETTVKIGTNCVPTAVDTKPTNNFNGWLMSTNNYP